MREVLFRGKKNDTGEWINGDFAKSSLMPEYKFIENDHDKDLVFPKSIGQFTGLFDKKGIKIFEGDILKSDLQSKGYFVVTFEHGSFCTYWTGDYGPATPMAWTFDEGFTEPFQYFTKYGTVVGNIHDNPELIQKP